MDNEYTLYAQIEKSGELSFYDDQNDDCTRLEVNFVVTRSEEDDTILEDIEIV